MNHLKRNATCPKSKGHGLLRSLKQKGYLLIEVMIGLLVLSIGVLALAAMQTSMLSNSVASNGRQIASFQAMALSDAIRSQREALRAGRFDNLESASATANSDCMTSTGCDDKAMAETTLANWHATLSNALSDGTGVVCRDSTPEDGTPGAVECDGAAGAELVIKVWWTEPRINPGATQRFVMNFEP